MTLYKIKLIEQNGNDEDITESYLSQKDFRKLMELYKTIKGLR